MKRLLILLFVTLQSTCFSQTQYRNDFVETFSTDWSGIWWTPAITTGYFTNAFVSTNSSATIYGSGNGSSGIEQDWYSFPNISLNPLNTYKFKFRLASYSFSNPTATTRGIDGADYLSVLVSTNGGASYVTELRITGNSNSLWNYNATGTINHIANGVFNATAAPAGDIYQAPIGTSPQTFLSNGPTFITLELPVGISQVAIDVYCRVNSNGEEWWMDNFELIETPGISLPVELTEFEASSFQYYNVVNWTTASEYNSLYYNLEMSVDGLNWTSISNQSAAGYSNHEIKYSFIDYNQNRLTYYRLTQYDNDGQSKGYGPISVFKKKSTKKVTNYVNLLGQEIDPESHNGVYFEVYEDGTSNRFFK
jgi:hypothetical protein